MYELSTFYNSKEWRRLLQTLKMERVNDQGELICEYCGKPISRAYDAIGHHKTELTDENVNDADISLNPDNVAFVHHRCHNYIHNKLGHRMREVFLVYGPPLAGKGEWVKDNMEPGDLVVDMDAIWQCISAQNRYTHPNRLRQCVFEVRNALLDAVRFRRGKWQTAFVVGGYAMLSERERVCRELAARQVFVDATREECLAKLDTLPELDRSEWERYVADWFETYEAPLDL